MRYTAILLLSLTAACSTTTGTTGYSADQARADLVTVQKAHAVALSAELLYLRQAPCGLAGSLPAPLCASYKVGVQMQAANKAADGTIAAAEAAVENIGDNPNALKLAVEGAKAAMASWQALTAAYAPPKP